MTSIKTLAALLIVGAAFSACSSSDSNIIDEPTPVTPTTKTYKLTVKATKGDDATRALSVDGNTITTYWDGNETIDVIKDNGTTREKIGTATAAASPDGSTTITATLTKAPTPGTDDLLFALGGTEWDYTGQNGTLVNNMSGNPPSISKNYDYAVAELAKSAYTYSGDVITTDATLNFLSKQAIVKFIFKDKATDNYLSPSSLTIHVANDGLYKTFDVVSKDATYGDLTIGNAFSGNHIFASLAGVGNTTVTLTATVGDDTYTYEKSGVTFTHGKFYAITVKMTPASPFESLTNEDLGKVIGADGNIYDDPDDAITGGTTPVAKIVYVGDDAETSTTYNHGLALALSDVSDLQFWCSQTPVMPEFYETCRSTQYQYSTVAKAKTDMAGIANTDALVNHTGHAHHYAAEAARNYNGGTHPTGTSAWFLPSVGQWDKMATAAGSYIKLRENVGLAGSPNFEYYWSSSERSAQFAWQFDTEQTSNNWSGADKHNQYRVRACLAF